jgi:hypothetical protein
LYLLTLDGFSSGTKIKIVRRNKLSWVQKGRRAKRDVRPYTLRVSRDHGGGLWTFEASDGQLYLGVLSNENTRRRRELEERRRSAG